MPGNERSSTYEYSHDPGPHGQPAPETEKPAGTRRSAADYPRHSQIQGAGVFDEIRVNSEHDAFGGIANQDGVGFHKRSEELASNVATSEQFAREFLLKHPCEYVFQVHSIALLLTAPQVAAFVRAMIKNKYDTLLSCTHEQTECAYNDQSVCTQQLEVEPSKVPWHNLRGLPWTKGHE